MPDLEMQTVTRQTDSRDWLIGEFGSRLAAAMEALTEETQRAVITAMEARPSDQGLIWRQPFGDISGAIWIVAQDDCWRGIGAAVLRSKGIEESADQLRSEYLEIVRQATAVVARAMAEKFGREVTPGIGEQVHSIGEAQWGQIEMTNSGGPAKIAIGIEPELLAALTSDVRALPSSERSASKVPENSKTFELLLDLELPVSISFGRAGSAERCVEADGWVDRRVEPRDRRSGRSDRE
jgi:hypothetical protein